jgi:hypothetical protein
MTDQIEKCTPDQSIVRHVCWSGSGQMPRNIRFVRVLGQISCFISRTRKLRIDSLCQRNHFCLQKVEILESNCSCSVNFLSSQTLVVTIESQIVAVFVTASNELWCWRWWQNISMKSFIFWDKIQPTFHRKRLPSSSVSYRRGANSRTVGLTRPVMWFCADRGRILSGCTIGSFSRRAQLREWVNVLSF